MTIFTDIQKENNINIDDKFDDNIDDKYVNGLRYIYNNFDKLMMDDKFKHFIIYSEPLLHKYHTLFNTDDRKEVIAKYVMLSIQLLLS